LLGDPGTRRVGGAACASAAPRFAERSTVRCRRSSQRCRRRWRRRRRSCGRYRQARHPAGRRRFPAARVRRAGPCPDRDAGAPGRATAYLRGGGRGARPRGARRSRAVKDVSQAGALVIARSLNAPLWTPDRVGARLRPHTRDRSNGTLQAASADGELLYPVISSRKAWLVWPTSIRCPSGSRT
jgi:hypothetical protein